MTFEWVFWENFSPVPKLLLNDPTNISYSVDSVTPRRVCSRKECAKAYRKQQECRGRAVAATSVHPYYWGTAGALNTLHITWCNSLTERGEMRTKAAAFTASVMCFTGFDQCWNLWGILDAAVYLPLPFITLKNRGVGGKYKNQDPEQINVTWRK